MPRRAQRGLSLLELMVAAALGLLVVGGVLFAYLGSLNSARQLHALTRMTEDAQMALNLMARDLRMAGYAAPTGVDAAGKLTSLPGAFRPLFGCETDFQSTNVAFQSGTCTPAGTGAAAAGPSALEVNLQASNETSALSRTSSPVDCLGNDATRNNPNQTISLRYYLAPVAHGSGKALHCASSAVSSPGSSGGSGSPIPGQPLIDNVEALVVRYGLRDAVNPQAGVARYAAADAIAATDWPLVVAVRLCVLMRSAEPVLTASGQAGGSTEESNTYRDCSNTTQTSNDRYLRRAYQATVVIRSQEGSQAWLVPSPAASSPSTPGTPSLPPVTPVPPRSGEGRL